jgi:CubicO group peptidase (beta-lactamase class C family)
VVDIWGGCKCGEGAPWEETTTAPSFSTTKGVASTVLHILADKGLIQYDQPVSHYWPEFGQAGKERITVRQVLCHQSGLYHVRQMIDHADRMIDWDHMIEAIEKSAPIHEPGARIGYHGLTYGYLVGEIIHRVTQKPFSEVVEGELAGPLGLEGFFVGAPKHEIEQAAQLIGPQGSRRKGLEFGQILRKPVEFLQKMFELAGSDIEFASALDLMPRGISSIDFSSEEFLSATLPSINGLFTARSLARMYAMLAGGGIVDGVRLISPKTFLQLSEIQHPPKSRGKNPFDLNWRLGYHRIGTINRLLPEAFGHFGFGGSGAWADPSRELSMALIVNSGSALLDTRILRMGAAVVKSADGRH